MLGGSSKRYLRLIVEIEKGSEQGNKCQLCKNAIYRMIANLSSLL